jgi:hypothetical protein
VSCVSGDGIDGGPVWWTDPYTAWAAKKKADKAQKRKAETSLDDETEARLKALRGEGSSSAGGSGSGMPPPPPPGGGAAGGGGGGGGMALDSDVEARLRALRGEGGGSGGDGSSAQDQSAYGNKGYDSD